LCQKNPPEIVNKEFPKKYSSAQSVKWETEEKNEWEAEFKSDEKKCLHHLTIQVNGLNRRQ
jgi:hypothetical protein